MHLPGVDATGRHRHDTRHRRPVLVEEDAVLRVHRDLVLAQGVVEAAGGGRVALELPDDGACVHVVDAHQPRPLRDHPEAHAVRLLPRVRRVPGAVQVQQHAVLSAPVRHRLDRRVADRQVDHEHDAAELLGELRAAVHLLHGPGGHVQVVALDLAGLGHRLVDALHGEEEAVAPAHERLGVDVLVVLGEVETALAGLVDDAAVVARGQAELRLGGRAEQRTAVLVEHLSLHDDAVRRALEGLGVGDRDPHVLEPEGLERLEPEDVADDRRGEVGDRAFLEEVDVVGDVGEVLTRPPRDRVDAVGLGLVVGVGGQPVGPHHGPGGGGGLPRHGRRGLDRVDAVLGGHPEDREHVGVLRLVVRVPVAHPGVALHARIPALLRRHGVFGGGHGPSSRSALRAAPAWARDRSTTIDSLL